MEISNIDLIRKIASIRKEALYTPASLVFKKLTKRYGGLLPMSAINKSVKAMKDIGTKDVRGLT